MEIRGEALFRHELGAHLRRLRHERNERLTDTADRAGISPQYLSEIERGLKDPSSEMLAAIAGALGTEVGEIAVAVGLRLQAGTSRPTVRLGTVPTGPRANATGPELAAPARHSVPGPRLLALAA